MKHKLQWKGQAGHQKWHLITGEVAWDKLTIDHMRKVRDDELSGAVRCPADHEANHWYKGHLNCVDLGPRDEFDALVSNAGGDHVSVDGTPVDTCKYVADMTVADNDDE